MNKSTLICLLDKPYPPDHSFVTGMLAQALPNGGDVRVRLLVMAPDSGPLAPARYHRAVCLPMIPDFSRRGDSRLRAMLAARRLASALIDKARRRGERAVLFVRNHPALLLVAASLRHAVDGLVFQSSYPLELQDKGRVGRFAYRSVLRIGGHFVDGVIAVSPLGLQRAQALCSRQAKGLVVPLLSDLPRAIVPGDNIWGGGGTTVRCIYTGTHAARRRLDVVLEGAVAVLDSGADVAFAFVGGSPEQIDALRHVSGVRRLEDAGFIRFVETVPRPTLPRLLMSADFGLSLVPETPLNREMSPTKLSEYLGAGLAVLASRGVDLQETFVQESEAGILVPFDRDAIADGIRRLAMDREYLETCKINAERYAGRYLDYAHYAMPMSAIIKGRSCISSISRIQAGDAHGEAD